MDCFMRTAALIIIFTIGLACTVTLPRAPVDGTVVQSAGAHPGIDFGGPPWPIDGKPVTSVCRGRVAYAATGWNGGCGTMVSIVHDNGYKSEYCHLSGLAVSSGQIVGTGQLVGWVGSTGKSTGPHLHLQFFHNGVLLVNELNGAFPSGKTVAQGSLWGAGLDPALSCP